MFYLSVLPGFPFFNVTEYSSVAAWLWKIPAKPEVLHKESDKLLWMTCTCHPHRVFKTMISNSLATPADFWLTRVES